MDRGGALCYAARMPRKPSVSDAPTAAICLHGMTASPYEMQPVADALSEMGLEVASPRLAGHGVTVELMAHTRWDDWLAVARRALDEMLERHERVLLAGLSMGALLSLCLAHQRGGRIAGVVAMATPLELPLGDQLALSVARRFPGLADLMPYSDKDGGPDVSDPAVAASLPSYDRIPVAAAASLLDGQDAVRDRLDRITAPVLVLHGRHDHTAPVSNAHRLYRSLRTPWRRLIVYPRSWHILTHDVEHEQVAADVSAFARNPKGFSELHP